jgi:Pyruvate/2-oxoacid:ferredoxin oxidoreductase delta subunit
MQGLIYCYSTTGNTRLVADRIAAALGSQGVEIEVRDPLTQASPEDFGAYDVVGFGTPTMAWKPSWGFYEVLGLIPRQKKLIPCFVFCTSGGLPVNTLRIMGKSLSDKNFLVFDGLEVTAETNWPVARQFGEKGQGFIGSPNESDLEVVGPFAERVAKQLASKNLKSKIFDLQVTPLHLMGKRAGPKELRRVMGTKRVDRKKCIQCAACAIGCAARAISLRPHPVFSNRCMGCWACYNNCPTEAITTTVTGGRGRYKGPALGSQST